MIYLHCGTRTRIPTRTFTLNWTVTVYCAETVPNAQTETQILILIQTPDRCCTHFYPPQRKFLEGIVFTGICLVIGRGVGNIKCIMG